MAIQPRVVVTGHNPDGTSAVTTDRLGTPTAVGAYPGSEFYLLWGTDDGGAGVGTTPRQPRVLPFFPGPGGTRVLFARFQPESSTAEPVGDPEDLAAELDDKLPGLRDVFAPGDTSGMHATDTIDYGICLEGELTLVMDNGDETVLTPGTCVVQRGTRHAWHNRADRPALMCFVGVGAVRDP